MSENGLPSILVRVSIALIPLVLGALVAVAWQNSHQMARNQLRLDADEKELAHLRALVEDRLSAPPPQR